MVTNALHHPRHGGPSGSPKHDRTPLHAINAGRHRTASCAAFMVALAAMLAPGVASALVGQSITLFPVSSLVYSPGATFAISASASSGLAVTLSSDTPSVCGVAASNVTVLAAGTCVVRASQPGDAVYAAAVDVLASTGISAASQYINFPPLSTRSYAPSATFAVSASATSGLPVTFVSDSTPVCTLTGNVATVLAAGTCTIRARQAGDGNWNPAVDVLASIGVDRAPQSIDLVLPGSVALSTAPVSISVAASSGLSVNVASQTPSTCSIAGNAISLLAPGTCAVRASQAGGANYLAAAPVDRSFTVTPAATQMLLQSSSASVAYGMPISLAASVSGFSPTGRVDFMMATGSGFASVCNSVAVSGGSASCAVPGALLHTSPAIFVASYGGDTNNHSASANNQVMVAMGQASISVAVMPTMPVAGRSLTLHAMVSQGGVTTGLAFNENGAALPGCSAVPLVPVGGSTSGVYGAQCVVSPTTAGTHNYVVTYPSASGTGFDQVVVTVNVAAAGPQDYTGMWWAGVAENGWGMSIDQHGATQFVLFYVYDAAGTPVWYAMPGGSWDGTGTVYTGALYQPTGTPFTAYDASRFKANTSVGSATITYTSAGTATIDFNINGVSASKQVSRMEFGDGRNIGLSVGDMWWAGADQNGWGMNISQQGSVLFPIWYAYDANGRGIWYAMPGGTWNGATYTGDLYQTTSSAWLGVPYQVGQFTPVKVGRISLTFVDANAATVVFEVNGVVGTSSISRQPF